MAQTSNKQSRQTNQSNESNQLELKKQEQRKEHIRNLIKLFNTIKERKFTKHG
tara:strand:+ start:45 stop:203 length:159 start_codon:yes stop_codon:yes gene_type:complete